jgi:carboxyl-terminal processing protease
MSSNSKFNFIVPIILAITLSIGLWLGYILTPSVSIDSKAYASDHYLKMRDIIEILNHRYVDTLNGEKLFEQTLADMLHKLDPHSNYIPARDLAQVNESIEGKFGGIGVRFLIIRDTICITNVISNAPAYNVGIIAGDKIIDVGGKSVANKNITNEKVMKLLKGVENSSVQLTILRKGKKITKQITRGSIPIESVSVAYMITPTIGFIKIDQFSVSTADEFKVAAFNLKQKGMKNLILDLRNNGGGVMQAATEIADEFLANGIPIVKTKGIHTGSQTYRATSKGMLEKMEVAVLINENAASASEILAGAIQDNDRGIIIGRRSFGKGLVQEDMRLRDGSNLRLTIARYYTPTGRCIQKPYNKGYDSYVKDQLHRYENNEMYQPDSSLFVDSLKFKTPKGKVVYGGGGIMPDVFVPLDTTSSTFYFTTLLFSQAFQTFAFDFVQDKRKQWTTVAQYDKQFSVNQHFLKEFMRFADSEFKIKCGSNEFEQSKNLIARTLKAEIARQLWLENGYYYILNKTDNETQRALKCFSH